jgi:hypothetical protein
VPIKPFHFDADFDEVHLVLFEAYLRVSALCWVLRGIVEEEGREVPWADVLLQSTDSAVVKAVRRSAVGPSTN